MGVKFIAKTESGSMYAFFQEGEKTFFSRCHEVDTSDLFPDGCHLEGKLAIDNKVMEIADFSAGKKIGFCYNEQYGLSGDFITDDEMVLVRPNDILSPSRYGIIVFDSIVGVKLHVHKVCSNKKEKFKDCSKPKARPVVGKAMYIDFVIDGKHARMFTSNVTEILYDTSESS